MVDKQNVSQDQLARAARLIIDRIKNQDLVTYKAFGQITGIESTETTSTALHIIAEATHKYGCGLANVVVRSDDGNVGYGFFLGAAFLGYRIEPHDAEALVLSQTYEVFSMPSLVEAALTKLIEEYGENELSSGAFDERIVARRAALRKCRHRSIGNHAR